MRGRKMYMILGLALAMLVPAVASAQQIKHG